MTPGFNRSARRAGRTLVLWALLLALPVYGCAGTLLQMLGSMHRHAIPAVAGTAESRASEAGNALDQRLARLVRQWRVWQNFAHERVHAGGSLGHAHSHRHAAFERHHHAPDDDVIAVGAREAGTASAGESSATAGLGSAMLAFGLAALLAVPRTLPAKRRWLRARALLRSGIGSRRRDRPPRG